ncbi:MAG: hypothetical protein JWQ57_3494 [Mucilaginibacter sp.]|nr:hypothetical protein [Mucilaginibacter sp.]
MLNKTSLIFTCLLAVCLTSCSRKQKFDRDKWDDGDGITFAYRPGMVNDLIESQKLNNLRYQQVIHLLHRPQLSSKDSMIYDLDRQYNKGIMVSSSSLVIFLKDSVVTKAEVHEIHSKKK